VLSLILFEGCERVSENQRLAQICPKINKAAMATFTLDPIAFPTNFALLLSVEAPILLERHNLLSAALSESSARGWEVLIN
jgi:hypothetical protein